MFLHALGAWPSSWEAQVRGLPDDFVGVAPDIPGVTEADKVRFDFGSAAGAIVAAIDQQGVARAHVCGLSLGAMVATQIAIDHPARVSSLVLSGSQVAPNLALMAAQRAVIRLLPEKTAARFGMTKKGWLAMLREIAAADFRSGLSDIDVPTLVLCGSRDVANLPAARLLARSVPGAELKVVKGAGHEWNLQFPELFNDVIGDFYRSLGDRS
ncbi:pimeloyl-ACP methyl ester carboxylesterase [Nocardioides albertanoniae]|uniref:Pimeloyl-ACP methyl ester carboxylesterase n=2 Tax=Nocardioides albertanoniae TaxID=1175486 RepID=A0A543A1T6_9ACTN|nr:pimeloyl-ACP methyl ester carboxylesterase [Nocardioides albertanoniae]